MCAKDTTGKQFEPIPPGTGKKNDPTPPGANLPLAEKAKKATVPIPTPAIEDEIKKFFDHLPSIKSYNDKVNV